MNLPDPDTLDVPEDTRHLLKLMRQFQHRGLTPLIGLDESSDIQVRGAAPCGTRISGEGAAITEVGRRKLEATTQ